MTLTRQGADKVPDQITAKQKTYNYYIRYNSSTIVPKNEYERELINLANRMPFDDRGNDDIKLTDISPLPLARLSGEG